MTGLSALQDLKTKKSFVSENLFIKNVPFYVSASVMPKKSPNEENEIAIYVYNAISQSLKLE